MSLKADRLIRFLLVGDVFVSPNRLILLLISVLQDSALGGLTLGTLRLTSVGSEVDALAFDAVAGHLGHSIDRV